MSYAITWSTEGVIWTFSGVLTGEDAIQANLDIYGDPRFDDLRYQIVDISGVERFELSSEALETAAAMDEAAALNNSHIVVAVVAPGQMALLAAQTYKSAMRTASWKTEIFGSLEEARDWALATGGRWPA